MDLPYELNPTESKFVLDNVAWVIVLLSTPFITLQNIAVNMKMLIVYIVDLPTLSCTCSREEFSR